MKAKTRDGRNIIKMTKDGYCVVDIKNGLETQIKYYGKYGASTRLRRHTTWFDDHILLPVLELIIRIFKIDL